VGWREVGWFLCWWKPNEKGKEDCWNARGIKKETIDVDLLLSDYELGYLYVARLYVSEIGDVAWCELFLGGCKK
jgi:hypothetical protein